jgi:hypothetical protein
MSKLPAINAESRPLIKKLATRDPFPAMLTAIAAGEEKRILASHASFQASSYEDRFRPDTLSLVVPPGLLEFYSPVLAV